MTLTHFDQGERIWKDGEYTPDRIMDPLHASYFTRYTWIDMTGTARDDIYTLIDGDTFLEPVTRLTNDDYELISQSGQLQLQIGGVVIATFASIYEQVARDIVFCLNLGCDIMSHIQGRASAHATLEDVIVARVNKESERR